MPRSRTAPTAHSSVSRRKIWRTWTCSNIAGGIGQKSAASRWTSGTAGRNRHEERAARRAACPGSAGGSRRRCCRSRTSGSSGQSGSSRPEQQDPGDPAVGQQADADRRVRERQTGGDRAGHARGSGGPMRKSVSGDDRALEEAREGVPRRSRGVAGRETGRNPRFLIGLRGRKPERRAPVSRRGGGIASKGGDGHEGESWTTCTARSRWSPVERAGSARRWRGVRRGGDARRPGRRRNGAPSNGSPPSSARARPRCSPSRPTSPTPRPSTSSRRRTFERVRDGPCRLQQRRGRRVRSTDLGRAAVLVGMGPRREPHGGRARHPLVRAPPDRPGRGCGGEHGVARRARRRSRSSGPTR